MLNWHSDFGTNIKTSMFGPRPSFCTSSWISLPWTSKSGNLGSTTLSCAIFATLGKEFWRSQPWTPTLSLAWPLFGVVPNTNSHHKWSSERFQNWLELWTIIHALRSNTKARFETTEMLRSSAGGLTRCYALRRLGNNIQEPYRTLSLQAIDACIRWWRGKPAPRASALSTWATDGSLQHATGSYRCQDMLSRSGPSSVGLWEGSNVHVNQPATTTDSRLQGWNWLPRALSVLWMRSWMQHFH